MRFYLRKINPAASDNTVFSDYTGYKTVNTNVHAMQRNFLNVTNLNYYIPNELDQEALDRLRESGQEIQYLSNGDIDPVQLLFQEQDEAGIQKVKDPYGVAVENWPSQKPSQFMKKINVLVPEGYRDVLSLDTTRPARFCVGSRRFCKTPYKVDVKGMATKVPGSFFTAY